MKKIELNDFYYFNRTFFTNPFVIDNLFFTKLFTEKNIENFLLKNNLKEFHTCEKFFVFYDILDFTKKPSKEDYRDFLYFVENIESNKTTDEEKYLFSTRKNLVLMRANLFDCFILSDYFLNKLNKEKIVVFVLGNLKIEKALSTLLHTKETLETENITRNDKVNGKNLSFVFSCNLCDMGNFLRNFSEMEVTKIFCEIPNFFKLGE